MKVISEKVYTGLEKLMEELKQKSLKINSRISEYNELLDDLAGSVEDIANDADLYHEDQRSFEWRQSDEGCAYDLWKDGMRTFVDFLIEIDEPDYPHDKVSLPSREPEEEEDE